jgi:hypothetical protein
MLLATLTIATSTVGCASRTSPSRSGSTEVQSITSTRFAPQPFDESQAVAASALVFDPPVALEEPALDLSRADRQPSAFFGYEEGFVEYYRLTVDDRQLGYGGSGYGGFRNGRGGAGGWGWSDRYERRAVSEKVGVIRR